MRILFLCALLMGCATSEPTPFETGEEVLPPMGCMEGRSRDVDC